MAIELHLVEQARIHGLKKFVHVGTVCAYLKFATIPFRDAELSDGFPEETNAPYEPEPLKTADNVKGPVIETPSETLARFIAASDQSRVRRGIIPTTR